MTSEEAIDILKGCELNPCVPKDKQATEMAIKALEQQSMLDKIRAEIEDLDIFYDNDYFSSNRDAMFKCSDVLQIIDKYRK